MGPTTYALCQKPVIGLAMWLANICAFPPLFDDAQISLVEKGSTAVREFNVPVDLRYGFRLRFEFPSDESIATDKAAGGWNSFCGNGTPYEEIPAELRSKMGGPVSFHIVIRRKSDQAVVSETTFKTLCTNSGAGRKRWRSIGGVDLKRGDYVVEVLNSEAHEEFTGINTYVELGPGGGK